MTSQPHCDAALASREAPSEAARPLVASTADGSTSPPLSSALAASYIASKREDEPSSSVDEHATVTTLAQQPANVLETTSDAAGEGVDDVQRSSEVRADEDREVRAVDTSSATSVEPPTAPAEAAEEERDLVWPVKTIIFPPHLPATPDNAVPIVLQNENGPCSLLALANILLLTRKVTLPRGARHVSYGQLAQRIADHLLASLGDLLPAPTSSATRALGLDQALDILPTCRTGLDVNISFGAVDGFAEDGTGALALFRLASVALVHGWVADIDDVASWEAIVTRAGDYDTAVSRLVEADELARGWVVPDGTTGEVTAQPDQWTEAQHRLVADALIIRRFLDTTASQLTYPGLFALASTLQHGSLAALFRNAHLSVIYRRPDDQASPSLFHLVTDATLARAREVVWEGLSDVDGAESEFYDAALRPCRLEGDFVGNSPRRERERAPPQRHPSLDMAEVARRNDPDALMAAQLQQAEYDADARRQERRERPPAPASIPVPSQARPPPNKKKDKEKCAIM